MVHLCPALQFCLEGNMNKFFGMATVGLVLVSVTGAFAHSGATGIVKERMEAMKEIGGEMKIIGGMFRGKITFDAKRLEKAAGVIGGHAEKIENLFPKGSDHKPTRALPEIWKNKAEFDRIGKDLMSAAAALSKSSKTAQSVDDIKMDLIGVGKTCKACHKQFRAPEH